MFVALLHHPVTNKRGDEITSAVTPLDLHDISRAAKTYGIRGFYVVTPLEDQRALAKRVLDHWREGYGASYNPNRKEALDLVRVAGELSEALADVEERCGRAPQTVITDARAREETLSYRDFRRMVGGGAPFVLLFGTAWGLTEDFIRRADHVLAPVVGAGDYNHLSVRSAAAIIFDRVMAQRPQDNLS